jgi:hypothetical protein
MDIYFLKMYIAVYNATYFMSYSALLAESPRRSRREEDIGCFSALTRVANSLKLGEEASPL